MKPFAGVIAFLTYSTTLAQAQGVPTQDTAGLGQLVARLSKLGEDLTAQRDQFGIGTSLSSVQADQLHMLERMSGSVSGPGLDIRALEGNADFPAGDLYPTTSIHPMDSRLFGEGRDTVEMMIVRVAGEYANAPGVRRAGLSATQWRCLFQALIKQESRFSVSAQSPAGAYGLTQLMPGTAADLGVDRHEVMDNLRGGARYITTQLNSFGTIPHALAAYNAGPGRVQQYGGVPPFAETQGYVRNISRFYNEYLAVVGGAEALGTLSPSDMALAEYGSISEASVYYAADSHATSDQIINRLAAIIRQIDEMPDIKRAIELNTYARAEIGRLLNLRIRLMAANHQRVAAHGRHLAADRLAERDFMQMGVIR
ncbi:lytic transglycosylase domain-containing protein [Ruegeria sp. 2205SS24-7]|uniref:lytic transglycosylase domain-containing protein n=1 Tax=Ruegeria discodermiae TaxID=3064389 RepID=UPI0027418C7E|nr:lytic transglycosylase domain-containing protein [Ruegeria sp. 2205SS24-7]MDP5218822.1 lytic transglycosylase domain-containing protein [Ruegeria sp. 2205SS24-7]